MSEKLTQAAIAAATRLHYQGEMTDRPTSGISVARWRAMIDQCYRYGRPTTFQDVRKLQRENGESA